MNRQCCCRSQPHISEEQINAFVKQEEYHLCNLPKTFGVELEGVTPYETREFFCNSEVPFRYRGCPRGTLTCCGSCTRICNNRCPQDVITRAHLLCGNIICAADEETRLERYNSASTLVQMLYNELTSEFPRYFVILATVQDYMSIKGEYKDEHKYDYASVIEYEETYTEHPSGFIETKTRKKVNPETGEVAVLYWPRSGMCPFCLPSGLVDRRRMVGDKNRRSKARPKY